MANRGFSLCALAVVGMLGTLCAANAQGAVVYTELGNQGTRVTTNYSPLSVVTTPVASPYGSHTITNVNGGILITFNPVTSPPASASAAFASSATNAAGGQDVDTDGKLDFLIQFDTPINLTAVINEGGAWSKTGIGNINVITGGVVVEAVNFIPQETIGTSSLATTGFNGGASGTWTGTATLTGFVNKYTTYHFSIDNDLFASAPSSATASTAAISKTSFSIFIPGVPEPTSLGLLGLGVAGLVLRRRR